eukprot:g6595.t1
MFEVLRELDIFVRYSIFALANILLLLWARYVVAPAKLGWMRFVRAVPLLVLCIFISCLVRFGHETGHPVASMVAAHYLWLPFWKCIGLCLNRGQLTKAYHSDNLVVFALVLLCSVKVAFRERLSTASENDGVVTSQLKEVAHPFEDVRFSVIKLHGPAFSKELRALLGNIVINLMFCVSFVVMSMQYEDYSIQKSFFLTWTFLFYVAVVQDIARMLCFLTLGIKLDVKLNKPYLATSMTEFWSKRWNLVMGEQLRSIIYNPILDGKLIANKRYYHKPKPSKMRMITGVFCVFFVSGIIHSLLLMQLADSGSFPVLYMLFFCVNSLIVVIEKVVYSFFKGSSQLNKMLKSIPSVVCIAYIHVVIITTGHFLHWPDVTNYGLTEQNLNGVLAMIPKSQLTQSDFPYQ